MAFVRYMHAEITSQTRHKSSVAGMCAGRKHALACQYAGSHLQIAKHPRPMSLHGHNGDQWKGFHSENNQHEHVITTHMHGYLFVVKLHKVACHVCDDSCTCHKA